MYLFFDQSPTSASASRKKLAAYKVFGDLSYGD
jgi:hypothetical protein